MRVEQVTSALVEAQRAVAALQRRAEQLEVKAVKPAKVGAMLPLQNP